jgi:ribulose 1,5-bisphosphate synthetase/thiazole synthase
MSQTLHPPLHRIAHHISTDLTQLSDQDTVDVVVVGSGAAGFSAANAAHTPKQSNKARRG